MTGRVQVDRARAAHSFATFVSTALALLLVCFEMAHAKPPADFTITLLSDGLTTGGLFRRPFDVVSADLDRDGDPDLLINFVLSSRETLQTRPSSSVGVHHGRGRYGTWGGYSMHASTTEVVQRTEGTLGVDLVDVSRNQLVWEGAATARVTDSMRQNRDQVLDSAIADIFAKFP